MKSPYQKTICKYDLYENQETLLRSLVSQQNNSDKLNYDLLKESTQLI